MFSPPLTPPLMGEDLKLDLLIGGKRSGYKDLQFVVADFSPPIRGRGVGLLFLFNSEYGNCTTYQEYAGNNHHVWL